MSQQFEQAPQQWPTVGLWDIFTPSAPYRGATDAEIHPTNILQLEQLGMVIPPVDSREYRDLMERLDIARERIYKPLMRKFGGITDTVIQEPEGEQ